MPKTILFGRLAAASIIAESSAIRPKKPSINVEELRRIQLAREEEKEEQHTVAMLKRDEVYFEKEERQTTQAKVIADLLLPALCRDRLTGAEDDRRSWQGMAKRHRFRLLRHFEPEELRSAPSR